MMEDTSPRLFSLGERREDIATLHAELALLGATVPADEARSALLGAGTAEAVSRLLGDAGRQEAAGVSVDPRTLDAAVQWSGRAAVFGTVTDPSGIPTPEISVRLIGGRVNGEELALGQADTDMAGRYMITYPPGRGHGPALILLGQAASTMPRVSPPFRPVSRGLVNRSVYECGA